MIGKTKNLPTVAVIILFISIFYFGLRLVSVQTSMLIDYYFDHKSSE